MHSLPEKMLLEGALLESFVPMVQKICQDILISSKQKNQNLNRISVLTLSKFMCVSVKFCKDNLDLLIGLLSKPIDPVIKNNILITLGLL